MFLMPWYIALHMVATSEPPETGPTIPKEVLWVFGIVLLAYFIMRITMRRVMRHQKKFQGHYSERLADRTAGQEIQNQMHELMASLADLSRQINGQIDMRLAKLELLLRQADEMITHLGKTTGTESEPIEGSGDSSFETAAENLKETVEQIQSPSQHDGKAVQPPPDDNISPESPPNPPELSGDAREVLDMLERGLSPVAIAQELGRPVGEIELILSLAGKKGHS